MPCSYLKYVTHNRKALQQSTECVCIFCNARMKPDAIIEWTGKNDTAICPECSIDAVVSNKSIAYTQVDIDRWHQEGFGNISDSSKTVLTVYQK